MISPCALEAAAEVHVKESNVSFSSGDISLEGLIAVSDKASGLAVVCHPHPQYGGSMLNNVVEAILDAFWQQGYGTLRFNFRGVGNSGGSYGNGVGEAEDASA